MSIFKRRNRSVVGLLALVASAIFLLPVSGASAATQANACVNNILPKESSSIPITMTATASASPVKAGDSVTLSEIKQTADVPPTVFLSGYGLELLEVGVNKVPTKAVTQIAATNTVQGVQETNVAEGFAETTITDPTPGNRTSGDETATPGKLEVTYNNQTWTAAAAGEINFRENTVFIANEEVEGEVIPVADPPGFTFQNAGVKIEALVGGGAIKAKFGCDPGEVVEKALPSTIKRIETAATFASTQTQAPTQPTPPSPTPPSPTPENTAPNTKFKGIKIKGDKVTFTFSSTEKGSTFLCKLDKKKFAKCTSPKTYKSLKPGKHKFQVKARDAQGALDPSPAVKKFTIKK